MFFSFVVDVYSRRVVGWQFTNHMRTDLVLDAPRMALATRRRGADVELVHHSDAGSQYTSIDFQQVLDDHRVLASIGSVGDAYDNALAESFVDSFKTELIRDRVWRTQAQLELAVIGYVAWFNHDRLHEALGDIPPAEFEALHEGPRRLRRQQDTRPRGRPLRRHGTFDLPLPMKRGNQTRSPRNPARLINFQPTDRLVFNRTDIRP